MGRARPKVEHELDAFLDPESRAELSHAVHERLMSEHPLPDDMRRTLVGLRRAMHGVFFNVPIRGDCPAECLGLSFGTLCALLRGQSQWAAPETVADVNGLYRARRLRDFYGVGRRRLGEIETALVVAGVANERSKADSGRAGVVKGR